MFSNEESLELPEDLFYKAKYLFADQEKKPPQKKKNFTFFIALFLLFFIASPLIIFLFNLADSFLNFRSLKTALEKRDLTILEKEAEGFSKNSSLNLKFYDAAAPLFSFFGGKEAAEKTREFFVLSQNIGETLQTISRISQKGGEIFTKIFNSEEDIKENELTGLAADLDRALMQVSTTQGLLKNFSGQEFFVGSYISKAQNLLPEATETLYIAKDLINFFPALSGQRERKTYLVLFQNNSEIRPTGGFIGSYGLLTFDKGHLLDFEIKDVYFADGQLRGYVEPPSPLKTYLGQDVWYLRDSNWDPDFPTSAQRAEWFFEKETGRKVDGVIALNLTAVQKLIEVLGPIELPDYQEKITKDNFFEKAEYYSEKDFFPGSTGKQDFLGQVGRLLIEKIKNANQPTLILIAQKLMSSLEEKDLMAYFNSSEINLFLTRLNWDGSLKSISCQKGKNCLEDYLLVVEANLGVNKSNYFLKRSIEQTASLGKDGLVTDTLLITYENKSPEDVFPAGKYKTYLRIFVPQYSQLLHCRVDNLVCSPDQTIEHGRGVFGFLVEVPVKEKRRVELVYTLKQKLEQEYIFYLQKQSGVISDKDTFTFSFNYPENFVIENLQPPKRNSFLPFPQNFLTGKGLFVYNTSLLADFYLKADFLKK